MVEQSTEGRRCRGLRQGAPSQLRRQHLPHPQAAGDGLDIAFHSGDLPGKMHVRAGLEGELLIQGHGRIHIGIAVHTAETHEFRVLKARHLAEADCLRGIGQLVWQPTRLNIVLFPFSGRS